MLSFFADNWGSLIAGAIVAAVVVLILVKIYRDHKKGKSACGCGCENCPSSGACHKK